jgi:predicted component of type VI protein secretion system
MGAIANNYLPWVIPDHDAALSSCRCPLIWHRRAYIINMMNIINNTPMMRS